MVCTAVSRSSLSVDQLLTETLRMSLPCQREPDIHTLPSAMM